MTLRRRILGFLRDRMGADDPSLRLAFWDGEHLDFVTAPAVTIAIHDPRVLRRLAVGDFIDRSVFPGGEIPHPSRVVSEVSKAGPEVTDVEDLRPHYARPPSRWVERRKASAAAAQASAGMQRHRIWRMYMAGMGCAFDRGWLRLAQVVAYKPPGAAAMAPRPWTREGLYRGDAGEAESAPDWS